MWHLAGKTLNSHLISGTALFPSPEIMQQAIIASGAEIVTVALRRQAPGKNGGAYFWDLIKSLGVHILPNTAGCRTSKEAITLAHMARELFNTNWIKLEVTGDDYTLQPDPFALVEAAKILINDGFEVFPYTTSDLIVAQRLVDVGCKIIMPWGAPIGSGQGINDPRSLKILRKRLPEITLIVDAGIGKPAHAIEVMEMGYDGVLLNSAIALADKPVEMARAFALAVEAGRLGYQSGFMEERQMASPSTPTIGTPFWHKQEGRAIIDKPIEVEVEGNETSPKQHLYVKPIAWTIGGSDSGGGAGIQADIKTFNRLGAHGCSAITAITAQNTAKVQSVEAVSPNMLQAQLETLLEDLPPRAVKTGMLYSVDIIKQVARFFAKLDAFRICDPVMIATSGNSLLSNEDTVSTFIDHLLPHIDLLTPNLPEAKALLGIKEEAGQESKTYIQELAAKLRALGAKAVLIKGGHSSGELCCDYFETANYSAWLSSKRIETTSTHGTGCTLSATITAGIALGYSLPDAIVIGKAYVNHGLRTAVAIGKGHGPIQHGGWPETFNDLPALSLISTNGKSVNELVNAGQFPGCGNNPLGVYPIVNNVGWLEKLLPLGISTIQLRIKEGNKEQIEQEIAKCIELAKRYDCRLFINDYWQLAIKHGAYGVHLGQDDLDTADISSLAKAGLHLGVSAHSYAEAARALALKPSYIAIGPVYETNTKNVPFAPQGLLSLERWCRILPYPVVAIGGINITRLPEVLATGVDGVAVISDILNASDPSSHTKAWLETYDRFRGKKAHSVDKSSCKV